jgi:hypothetical protein
MASGGDRGWTPDATNLHAPSAQPRDKGGNIGQSITRRTTHFNVRTLRPAARATAKFPPSKTLVGHTKAVKPSESEDQRCPMISSKSR